MGNSAVRGRLVSTGDLVEIWLDGEDIAAIVPMADCDERLPWIGAGLVDLQVNGYGGIDLNGDDISPASISRLVSILASVGVTTFLPTVVTAHPGEIEARLQAIQSVVDSDRYVREATAGIHLEGPFISPEDGARGAHPLDAVRPPDWKLFEHWQDAAGGLIRIVTLSPEWPDAMPFIARCRATGVIPAIGHTAATPEQIRDAVAAGALLSTHLGNGAHATLPRHPNYIWEQLASDDLWASVIADGFHLSDAVLKTIIRMKAGKSILISDSVALAGMPPAEYDSPIGSRVVLTPAGKIHLADDPRLLAGSARPLLAGVDHLVRSGLTSLADAWDMASVRPLALLDRTESEGIAVGARADFVLFSRDDEQPITVEKTIRRGGQVYLRGENSLL